MKSGAVAVLAAASLAVVACGTAGPERPVSTVTPEATATSGQVVPLSLPTGSFEAYLEEMKARAMAEGVSAEAAQSALTGLVPNTRVMELDADQPEFTRPVWVYLANAVSERRIADGAAMRASWRGQVEGAARRYGVDPDVIIAIWGLETDYGGNLGGFNVIESLATLGWKGRRADFWRSELIAALKIVDAHDISASGMMGSWAGAMGHTQFMPSTFLVHARDGNGDGKRDIWTSLDDVFSSTANYLSAHGWKTGQPWGFEVKLPRSFAYETADITVERPLSHWIAQGVTRMNGATLSGPGLAATDSASILLPAGHRGAAFIVFNNFRTILKYNNSTSYGLAVGYLSDRISGGAAIAGSWPVDEPVLSIDQRKELQRELNRLGFPVGTPDGVIGKRTRAALREWQLSVGIIPDGYPTLAILEQMRAS